MSHVTRVALFSATRTPYSLVMDPHRLHPEVEIPAKRARPAAIGAVLAMLFSLGAYNYMASTRAHAALTSVRRGVKLTFMTEPQDADVVRERDGAILCRTPCTLETDMGRWGIAGYRLARPGFEDQRVLVDLRGGDTRVEAALQPVR